MIGGNEYFRVVAETTAYLRTAIYPSNTHFGRSQAWGVVYDLEVLYPGDEIHKLVGGTFVVREDGTTFEARYRLTSKHPFEKTYIPVDFCDWPDDVLEQIDSVDAAPRENRHEDTRVTAEWVYENCEKFGGSIDYYLDRRDSAAPPSSTR